MTQLKGSGRQPRVGRSVHILRRLSSRGDKGMVGTSRVNREVYARFCGRLEVKSLRPTRRPASDAFGLNTRATRATDQPDRGARRTDMEFLQTVRKLHAVTAISNFMSAIIPIS